MGGQPLANTSEKVTENVFWEKMKEVLGQEKFIENETAIIEHLKKPDSFIEFGDYTFTCK